MDSGRFRNQKNHKLNRYSMFTAQGIALVAAIMIISTLMLHKSSQNAANDTIHYLGEFYLKEMSDRVVEDIETDIEHRNSQMEQAIQIIKEEKINEGEELVEYLSRLKKMNAIDILVMVDENGIVYTTERTFSGISRFGFLSEKVEEPVIYTTQSYNSEGLIILAMPVEGVTVDGSKIVACYLGTDISKMLSKMWNESGDNKVFCRIFTTKGDSVLGNDKDYPDMVNLFTLLQKDAEFENDYTLEMLKHDWEMEKDGYVIYSGTNGNSYMYYKHIPETDWELVLLLKDSAIEDRVKEVSNRTLKGSVIQLLVIIVAMIAAFVLLHKSIQDSNRIMFEKQKEEELFQKESEASKEKIELQERLLEEEKRSHRHDAILKQLATEYSSVYYVDLDENIVIPYRDFGMVFADENIELEKEYTFTSLFYMYINKNVVEEDREGMYMFTDKDILMQYLKENGTYTRIYRIFRDNREQYARMRITKADKGEDLRYIVFGFGVADKEVREEQERQRVLRDALTQAELASKAKTSFLFNMSHDIRTPMNAIIGFTDLALGHLDDNKLIEDYLGKIKSSGNQLLGIINGILDMSRIESGKMVIDEEECSLSKIIYELRDILQADVDSKNINFVCNTNEIKHDVIRCDRVRINQILMNCLGNAIKFTPEGGTVSINVSESNHTSDNYASYNFVIKDTGIGMSRDFLEHIFEPFEREKTSTVSGVQGTGLGMAITKNLVDMMGGTINVLSELGVGTEFVISLGFKFDNDIQINNTGEEDIESQDISIKDVRVLVVEDNDLNREIMSAVLLQAGAIVDKAENGLVAVDKVMASSKGDYDIILMDIQMPVLNGYEATRRIRYMTEIEKSTIPIIAVSANAFEEDRKKSIGMGMNSHISKPINANNMIETVYKILKPHKKMLGCKEIVDFISEQKEKGEKCGYIIYESGNNSDVIFADINAIDMYGCSSAEDFMNYIQASYINTVHPSDWTHLCCELAKQDEAVGTHKKIRYRIVEKDGETRTVSSVSYKKILPDGRILMYVFLAYDE